ncbi:MAG: selenide, water dikinase SelD [Flavobacteriales bacterium]|jgi:selenide, water dikinase|nr:selenide, water dikinase SelD [Flavobacteriales bacterium]MBT4704605.1 selenide, water dikinase SelD [Flavobacteriales bacterium]MBT4930778.1 selenide, water dikinase SelD [Flavobacteriales bacterium]MBT5132111.1 selenide, water dikinase SelD [Flavobacteriales bacterium]MBT5976549.1 selenide, water dikinase SelD [Flavobacteriales bacterium]
MSINLTSFSHGGGCGCKLSPQVLEEILTGEKQGAFDRLLVGNDSKDDAAVYSLDGKTAIISTTDFFMPIVDDPFDFGAIAATNAISDIYAMGGKPMMAIAILGWPIEKLGPEVAREVIAGAKRVCSNARIPLAGGHSIDSPEPIFGLAVTGSALISLIKRNDGAKENDILFLTKPIGVGLVATAQKRGEATDEDIALAVSSMKALNDIGETVASAPGVNAITDVTGFGLAGHLIEMAEASNLSAVLEYDKIPIFPFTQKYLDLNMSPGGTHRNWEGYKEKVVLNNGVDHRLIADPQTSGGLLLSVSPAEALRIAQILSRHDLPSDIIGRFVTKSQNVLTVA